MARRRKSSLREEYDFLIVGGGPAGATAAWCAARTGATVLLIEREKKPVHRPCCGWLGPRAVELLSEIGLKAPTVQAAAFNGLTLRRWDLRAATVIADPELTGWIADRARLDEALLQAARDAGADVLTGRSCGDVALADDRVVAHLQKDHPPIRARVLFIADGARSSTADRLNLAPAGRLADTTHAILVNRPSRRPPGLEVVLGGSRVGLLATATFDGRQARIALTARDAPAALERSYAEFRTAAAGADWLDFELPANVKPFPTPSGAALDLESHVGKRCLLIGDAGGFASAFSNEGLYPSMRSAQLAVTAARAAFDMPVFQDALSAFEASWRVDLADYLRLPNTDLGLLAPLVFGNDEMARRVARAFLLGAQF